jgi:hypothetical protein
MNVNESANIPEPLKNTTMILDDLKAEYETYISHQQQFNEASDALAALVAPVKPKYFTTYEELQGFNDLSETYRVQKEDLDNQVATLSKLIKQGQCNMLAMLPMSRVWFKLPDMNLWVADEDVSDATADDYVDNLVFSSVENASQLPNMNV